MSKIFSFLPETGLVVDEETNVFLSLENDNKRRMWTIVAFRCMGHFQRQWETITPIQRRNARTLETSIERLCARFSKSNWPEIHDVRKEVLPMLPLTLVSNTRSNSKSDPGQRDAADGSA